MVSRRQAVDWYACPVWRIASDELRYSCKRGRVVADIEIHSDLLPGGDLISAVLNRQLMAFSDRGGSSGIIGQRWADHCGDVVEGWAGGISDVPGGRPPIMIDRVARLDAYPSIARAASKRGLQNPDFIVIGKQDGEPVLQAADAKFSIETARSRQVSAEVLAALLDLQTVLEPATGAIDPAARIERGFFMSPDYPLTQLMMRRRYGIMRVSVHDDEVEALQVDAAGFFAPAEGVEVMRILASVDGLPVSVDESLLAGLYYFRVARAAIGAWLDSVRPLLQMNDRVEIDIQAVSAEAHRRAANATSAYELFRTWDVDVERIRANRTAVDHVAGLPVINRELRDLIARVAAEVDAEPPSMNQVRRRLGAWFRGELRDRVGPLTPPIADFPRTLQQLAAISAELAPRIPGESERIVLELIAAKSDEEQVVETVEANVPA
jgi:hypothetical protein